MEQPVSINKSFEIPSDYNYDLSSESNYCCTDAPFVGKYKHIRSQLDYSYHKRYSVERQLLHDTLIDRFLKTKVHDRKSNLECEVPLENWIVFTAGPMGAGKGHTMQWLYKNDLFPLDAFVNVDPDALRILLPETAHYNKINDNTAGYLTQKEVGYISEVLSYDALIKGKNVLVDGSLRDAHWYLEYFKNLRDKFPIVKIAILHVTARAETVLLRARNRALVTGRHVPEETILESMRKIPHSLALLSRHAEFVATFLNEDDEPEPRLGQCCMQEQPEVEKVEKAEKQDVQEQGQHEVQGQGQLEGQGQGQVQECKQGLGKGPDSSSTSSSSADVPMQVLWCIQEMESSGDSLEGASPRTNSTSNTGDNDDLQTQQLNCAECYESFHRNISTITSKAPANMDITTGGSKISKIRRVYKLTECAPMPQMSLLDSWKDAFSRVWEMKCAVPVPPVPTTPHGVSVIETATTSADVVCASASTSASAGSEDAAACTTATVSMNSADSDSADIMNTCGTTAEKDRDIVTSSTAVSCEYTDDRISETDMKLCLKKPLDCPANGHCAPTEFLNSEPHSESPHHSKRPRHGFT